MGRFYDHSASSALAQDKSGSNKQPVAFGPDQTIIDLNKLVWEPLQPEGVPPGPEIAVLRGDGKAGGLEAVVPNGQNIRTCLFSTVALLTHLKGAKGNDGPAISGRTEHY